MRLVDCLGGSRKELVMESVMKRCKKVQKASDCITAAQLFEEIVQELRDMGKYPGALLDYALAERYDDTQLWDYRFDPLFVLKPGGSEGYYLDLAIRGQYGKDDSEIAMCRLGTMKTLREDPEGVREMGALYAECLLAYSKVVDRRLDDLTRKGYDLDFCREDGTFTGGRSGMSSEERGLEVLQEAAKRGNFAYAELRDNLTRARRRFLPSGEEVPKQPFYFTFGSSEEFPYQGGYLVVKAFDMRDAFQKFRDRYPDKTPDTLNCAFYYSEEEWEKAGMKDGLGGPWECID